MAVRVIELREHARQRNDALAHEVRTRLAEAGVPALNLLSSPGSGKTLLLERTLRELGRDLAIAVITGDVQTQRDAHRLARHTTAVVHAVVTGDAGHLEARQLRAALDAIDLDATDLLIVENVGSLVEPAGWDLGETARAVVFSVCEGEDKPLKYPRLFHDARWAVISKLDLLPHVPFDLHAAVGFARDVNPNVELVYTSALSGEGLDDWYDALRGLVREARGEARAPRVVIDMPAVARGGDGARRGAPAPRRSADTALRRGPGGGWVFGDDEAEAVAADDAVVADDALIEVRLPSGAPAPPTPADT
jgi:hydrogenase nickel incorporation protein HypB